MTSATATMYPFMESSFKLDPAATTTASHNSYSGYTLPASSQPGSHGVGQPQIVPSPSTNPHAYHHAASVAASGLYDPHRMFNGLNGLHSNPDPFPGLHDPMQSWAAQHHMAQHSNQMYPTYMNGMSAHHAAVASAAASASPAGAFFPLHEVARKLHYWRIIYRRKRSSLHVDRTRYAFTSKTLQQIFWLTTRNCHSYHSRTCWWT